MICLHKHKGYFVAQAADPFSDREVCAAAVEVDCQVPAVGELSGRRNAGGCR